MGNRQNNGDKGNGSFNIWAGIATAGVCGVFLMFSLKKYNIISLSYGNVTGDGNSDFNNEKDLSKTINVKFHSKEEVLNYVTNDEHIKEVFIEKIKEEKNDEIIDRFSKLQEHIEKTMDQQALIQSFGEIMQRN